jgi:CubicO group peptidase (beta-lactamase class C family)
MKASAPESGFDRLREAMTDRVQKQELPGMVILVDRGEDVQVETIGAMACESQDPMRRDTIFRITSMTKPILATAAMMLVEDGKLTLGEPVDRWLPELARRKVLKRIDGPLDDTVPAIRPITVEDLLTFRMGYGMLFEPTFEPPFPIIRRAAELQLVMGPPDPRTPHNPDEWIRHFGSLSQFSVLACDSSFAAICEFKSSPLGEFERSDFRRVEERDRKPDTRTSRSVCSSECPSSA